MARPFRTRESHEFERDTRNMLGKFLQRRGFVNISDERSGHGQTIIATPPNGVPVTMRVYLCWRRETGKRDSNWAKTYSAAQLLARVKNGDWEGSIREKIERSSDRRQIVERQIRERRGQQRFRDAMRKRYGDRCLVTGCEVLAVLEAAHIAPYRGDEDNNITNGLLLRADIHTHFDLDLIGIEPNGLRVELNPVIENDECIGRTRSR